MPHSCTPGCARPYAKPTSSPGVKLVGIFMVYWLSSAIPSHLLVLKESYQDAPVGEGRLSTRCLLFLIQEVNISPRSSLATHYATNTGFLSRAYHPCINRAWWDRPNYKWLICAETWLPSSSVIGGTISVAIFEAE